MPLEQQLARFSALYINTGGRYTITGVDSIDAEPEPAPEWVKISEVTNLSPSTSKGTADTTSYDNAGWDDHLVTNRGMTLGLSYNFVVDDSVEPPERDAGQAAIEELALQFGPDAVGQFKWSILNTGQVMIFNGTVDRSGPGGGTNDLAGITMTIQVKGIPYKGIDPELVPAP
jgi:hypothetical protein